jgi:hypothetical protein
VVEVGGCRARSALRDGHIYPRRHTPDLSQRHILSIKTPSVLPSFKPQHLDRGTAKEVTQHFKIFDKVALPGRADKPVYLREKG